MKSAPFRKSLFLWLPGILALSVAASAAVASPTYSLRVPFKGLVASGAPSSSCTAGNQAFAFAGANQSVTLPAGCSQATFEAWAGGGGGAYQMFSSTTPMGGGAGYAQVTYAAPPGTVFTLQVGRGGFHSDLSPVNAYPTGGANSSRGSLGGGLSLIHI
ncbi:hypothetical protein F6X40_34790 [Paraburkholderia sp. UCT31]|uniref:glycine-rich domain-containing protein n=1 Tax=Paraburkholderia sp. UCT31 TaxID=2615209 RepID=UPI001655BCA3|nr:hypothetical protein [Paraburkholderia sp. UCT31]MBC8741730.1 hypothetical protein [Paraburkholderia sp. UCT31]